MTDLASSEVATSASRGQVSYYARLVSRKSARDAAGASVLLSVTIVLTWPLWKTDSGVVNFVDYIAPVSTEAARAAFQASLSPWSGAHGLGGSNVGFLGTTEFLGLYQLVSTPFGVEIGSRLLLITLVWLDALGAYVVLRASYKIGAAAACAGGLFYILNPWVYDNIAQGHLYTLEVLAIAPFLILAIPRLNRITARVAIGIALAVAIAFGSDYHFGLLILLFLAMEAISLVIRGRTSDGLRLAGGAGAGLGLLSVYLLPYITSLRAIEERNNPAPSDLTYFSEFTSWDAAFSLLRPGMNAWAEVDAHGAAVRILWSLCCVAIAIVAGAIVLRGGWRRLTGSLVLPLIAGASVALANGANGVTEGAAVWAYASIPFAEVFRDPSKFLFFPLLLYVPTVALLSAGEAPRLLKGDRRSSQHAGAAPTAGKRRMTGRRGRSAWALTGPAVVSLLFLPLLVPGIRTISTVPTDSDSATSAPGTRLAYLPSWQFVRYPEQAVPVNDPLQVYPRTAVAGLGPDYDGGKGNLFLRWLYTALYSRRTDGFYNLARLAGVAAVAVRSGVEPVTGYSVTQRMFAEENLISSLRTQRAMYYATTRSRDHVTRRISTAAIVSGSSGLLRIHGTNRGVLNDIADLTNLGAPAICFEPDCPAGDNGLVIGALGDVPPEVDQSNLVQVHATSAYKGDRGGRWIDGQVAYGEGFGAITEQLGDVAVGIGQARGPLRFVGNLPTGTADLWAQVLRGPTPVRYSVECGRTRLVFAPPPTLDNFFWTWERAGALDVSQAKTDCTISMSGSLGAVAGGLLTSRSPPSGGFSIGTPEILVSPAAAAYSWTRAEGSSFDYPGVTSTAAIVADGGSLGFELPARPPARHVYANVLGIRGRVDVRVRGMTPPPTHFLISRDQRAWIDLGELRDSAHRVELFVTGGRLAVIRIAVAAPKHLAALRAIGASNVPVRLNGNIGLQGAGDMTVERMAVGSRATYLIVRSAADGVWSLDGRNADGTYAGYGQIYHVGDGAHTLSSVLKTRAEWGAAVSAVFAAGLLLVGTAPWLSARVRQVLN